MVEEWGKEGSGRLALMAPILFPRCVAQVAIQILPSSAWHTQTSLVLASRISQSSLCSGPAPIPWQHPPCQERSQSGTREERP